MRLLLDTHALVWFYQADPKTSYIGATQEIVVSVGRLAAFRRSGIISSNVRPLSIANFLDSFDNL